MRSADSFGAGSPTFQEKERKADGRMMVPEFRADQSGGYGGHMRVSTNGVSPSNSAVEILSRFRPIAPKPLSLRPGESAGSTPSDPPSSSTLSFERTSGGKAVSSERSRGKRSRKRIAAEPLLPPTRRVKRSTAAKPRIVSSKGLAAAGGIQKVVEQFLPDKSESQPMPLIPTSGKYKSLKGGVSIAAHVSDMPPKDYGSMLLDVMEANAPGPGRPERRKYTHGFGALTFGKPTTGYDWSPRSGSLQEACAPPTSDAIVGEEPAFMVRAAAASSPQPFFDRESNVVHKLRGVYDEVFDNCTKCGADGQQYRTPCSRPVDFMSNGSPFPSKASENHPRVADHILFARSDGEGEVNSDSNSRKANLVTLSLLPDTPSHLSNSSEAGRLTTSKHLPFLELAMVSDSRSWEAETMQESPSELHKLGSFNRNYEEERRNGLGKADGDCSWGRSSSSEKPSRALEVRALQEPLDKMPRVLPLCRESEDRPAVTDAGHMEQKYATSCDPMVLSDAESGEILWANQAYTKADTERTCGKTKDAGGPYLDPLGVPTRLSCFEYQTLEGSTTNAILWGFLKKFMRPEPSRVNLHPEARGDGEDKSQQTPERNFSSILKEEYSENLQKSHPKPITPQPVRPVGSTLTLERVYSTDQFASPITENLEYVKEQLESTQVPSVITDNKNRVSWVNAAYKQMVGQPECSWLESTVGKKIATETSQPNRLTGEVMLTCDKQLSHLSALSSCRVHVQWTNDGEENSITVPSEVTRIENEQLVMFLWKLDIWSTSSRPQNGSWRQDSGQLRLSSISRCVKHDQ